MYHHGHRGAEQDSVPSQARPGSGQSELANATWREAVNGISMESRIRSVQWFGEVDREKTIFMIIGADLVHTS
jgi:hypothetical protein